MQYDNHEIDLFNLIIHLSAIYHVDYYTLAATIYEKLTDDDVNAIVDTNKVEILEAIAAATSSSILTEKEQNNET